MSIVPTVQPQAAGFGCRLATLGPLVIAVFDDSKPQLEMLDILDQLQAEHIKKHGRISGINIVTMPRLAPPAAEFRTRSAALAKKHAGSMIGAAIVIATTGPVAVIARGFLAAYFLLVLQKSPQATFSRIAPAVNWLQDLPDQDPELRYMMGLTEAIDAFAFPRLRQG